MERRGILSPSERADTTIQERYSGSYEYLWRGNPDLPRGDRARLLERACTVNRFVCLPLLRVVGEQQIAPDQTRFDVELRAASGDRFVDQLNGRTSFQFIVRYTIGSPPVVLDLPPLLR